MANHIGYFRITLSRYSNYSSAWYFRCDPKNLNQGATNLTFSTESSTSLNSTVLSSFSYSNTTHSSENTDLDIYDANKGNLLSSNQSGGTIYYKIEVMKNDSNTARPHIGTNSGSLVLPPKFSFNAYTDFTNTSQTHTNETLNYEASWEGANTDSLYKDMRIRVKRVTTDGGNTMVSGTSEVSFTDHAALRHASDSDLNNILTPELFPSDDYESDITYYFKYTLEALGTNGTVLDTDTGSFSKNVFPRMLCSPGSRFTANITSTGVATDNTDMYAAVNVQGNVVVGMRYGLQFKGVGNFIIDTATADPQVKVYKEGTVKPHHTTSISGSSIGTNALNSTDELFYYDTWGSSYDAGQQGTANQGNYEIKASYKARGGNLRITNDSSSSKYSTFDISLPWHKFPTSGITAHRMLHYLDSSVQKLKISFINGNGDGDSSVVSLTSHSSGFSYKLYITETIVNSIKASNIGTQSSTLSYTSSGSESGNMYSFPWAALLQDEIYYVAKFDVNADFYYTSPSDAHYTYWKTKFDNFGLVVPTAGSEKTIGQFSDDSDGLDLMYQTLINTNPSLASVYNGVFMHSGSGSSGRVSELVPTSASVGSVNGTYAFSGNRFRFIFSSDPDTYFSNSTPRVAFGVKVNYTRKDNGAASESNIVVYNSAGSILGSSDGVNGASQSSASINGLISNRGSLSDLRTVTSGTISGQHHRDVTLNINYENSNFNFIGGLDTTQDITHTIYYYVEESINSTLNDFWDTILTDALKSALAAQGLTGIVYFDGSRDYRYPTGWRTLSSSYTKNLHTILSGHNHITSSGGVPSSEGFNAQLTATTGQVVSSIDYEPTSNTKSLPFSQSEEIVGYYLVTNQIDGSNSTSIDTITFSGNDSDWGANLQTGVGANSSERYSLTNTINLDVSAFDVRHDVEYSIIPFITSRTSFDGVNKETSSVVGFSTIGDSSIIYPDLGTVLGKSLTKNYQSEMVPSFSEIEFITPVDNTAVNAPPATSVPQVDVKFKYNSSEFASSSGDYFTSSRENIRIERFIVQGGVEYIPASETSKINDGDIFSISNSASGGKKLFTLSDTFGHAAQANDVVASGVDVNSVYIYRYLLIPGFVYNPGGGGEKRVEFPSMANNTFDIVPTNLSINLGLVDISSILYNPGHSQEIFWDYTYSESVDEVREMGNEILFQIYSRIKEDNNRDDYNKEVKYNRKKLDTKKNSGWVLRDSFPWELDSYNSGNIDEVSSFQRVIKYDEFSYDHKAEIVILVKVNGDFAALGHTLNSHANGGINTAGMAVDGVTLKPSDFNKIPFLLSDEEKVSLVSRKMSKSIEEFTLNNNLEQVPISITRKKARVRGGENNPPYSSST